MTRYDFQVIANVIQQIPNDHERRIMALRFRDGLRAHYHKFNSLTFFRACGLPKGEAEFLHDITTPDVRSVAGPERAYAMVRDYLLKLVTSPLDHPPLGPTKK